MFSVTTIRYAIYPAISHFLITYLASEAIWLVTRYKMAFHVAIQIRSFSNIRICVNIVL